MNRHSDTLNGTADLDKVALFLFLQWQISLCRKNSDVDSKFLFLQER